MKRSYRTDDMKCDQCGKVELIAHVEHILPGWISLNKRVAKFVNSEDTGEISVDFCCWECAEKFCFKMLNAKP